MDPIFTREELTTCAVLYLVAFKTVSLQKSRSTFSRSPEVKLDMYGV